MKLTAERLPESQIRLEIISDEAEFATALDKASKRVAQRVTVPGFRRGKAPRTLVERHVGRAMIVDEANGARRRKVSQKVGGVAHKALYQPRVVRTTRPLLRHGHGPLRLRRGGET